MCYHLAQPKQILSTGIVQFLPYFHYNFPRTFNLLFIASEYVG